MNSSSAAVARRKRFDELVGVFHQDMYRYAAWLSRDRTIVLSTHIVAEMEKLCDDVAILHKGRILECGPVDEVKARAGTESIEELFFQRIDACEAAS